MQSARRHAPPRPLGAARAKAPLGHADEQSACVCMRLYTTACEPHATTWPKYGQLWSTGTTPHGWPGNGKKLPPSTHGTSPIHGNNACHALAISHRAAFETIRQAAGGMCVPVRRRFPTPRLRVARRQGACSTLTNRARPLPGGAARHEQCRNGWHEQGGHDARGLIAAAAAIEVSSLHFVW